MSIGSAGGAPGSSNTGSGDAQTVLSTQWVDALDTNDLRRSQVLQVCHSPDTHAAAHPPLAMPRTDRCPSSALCCDQMLAQPGFVLKTFHEQLIPTKVSDALGFGLWRCHSHSARVAVRCASVCAAVCAAVLERR